MRNGSLFIPATKARNNFFGLLEQVKTNPFPIHITVKGIPEVVLISKEDYDGWMATIETLSDPQLLEAIKEGNEDIKAGRYTDWEDVKKELRLSVKHRYVSNKAKQQVQKKSKKAR